MNWKFEKFAFVGQQCMLFDVNIFDYNWEDTGERVQVKDPLYHQEHTFRIWQVKIGGQLRRFAAGEFSNDVYGFYLEDDRCICDSLIVQMKETNGWHGLALKKLIALEEQGAIELFAGDCPLKDAGTELDKEQHFTVCHYVRCRSCGAIYFVGACIRGAPIYRKVENLRKEKFDTLLWGRFGTYFSGDQSTFPPSKNDISQSKSNCSRNENDDKTRKRRYGYKVMNLLKKFRLGGGDIEMNNENVEPPELAQAMMDYLDCECTYFPSMADDAPIMSAYRRARKDGVSEGFVPVLVAVDEVLWECLIINSDPNNDGADDYAFDSEKVAEYRKKALSAPMKDGKAVLEEIIRQRRLEAEEDDMDWEEEILGDMKGGYNNCRFSGYQSYASDMTDPLILAKIPMKNPWEIFAYLPFGNWNECPDTPELMAAAKYWFEQYGAVPGTMTHDVLEFELPAPVPKERAMEAAIELYGFCPDIVDQGTQDAMVGSLADILWRSTVWYFWWD